MVFILMYDFPTSQILSTLHTQVPGGMDEQNVEAVAFSLDASLPLAAYGTLEGYLFIWDLAHQVCMI